jgi:hypothetical protein
MHTEASSEAEAVEANAEERERAGLGTDEGCPE